MFEIKSPQTIHDHNTGVALEFVGRHDTVTLRIVNSRDGTASDIVLYRRGEVLSIRPAVGAAMLVGKALDATLTEEDLRSREYMDSDGRAC